MRSLKLDLEGAVRASAALGPVTGSAAWGGVALGTLISCYVYGWGFEEAKSLLDTCRTRYRPQQIGCSWEEALQVLQKLPRASQQLVPNHNYFQRYPIDTPTFESLQAAIEE